MTTTSQRRAHLGKGWRFPVRPEHGRLRFVEQEEDVEQAIGIVLETARRERLMNPAFGAGLRGFVFDANSPATHRRIESEVTQALVEWEPRIEVEAVRASRSPEHANVVLIEVDYVLRRNNAFYNLVYPFYLSEGV